MFTRAPLHQDIEQIHLLHTFRVYLLRYEYNIKLSTTYSWIFQAVISIDIFQRISYRHFSNFFYN
jgi:hypothetical protein